MTDNSTTIQVIGITATIATLLGWTVRFMFRYFTKKLDAKDSYIAELVNQGQKNTENFVNTINHNQTKMNTSVDNLASNIKDQNQTMKDQTEIFKQLIRDNTHHKR